MRNPKDTSLTARRVLAIDGLACAVVSIAVVSSRRLARAIDPTLKSRVPAAIALGITSVTLLGAALKPKPSARDLKTAAIINAGWTLTCTSVLRGQPSRFGAFVLAATAAFDAVAAFAQWSLSQQNEQHSRG